MASAPPLALALAFERRREDRTATAQCRLLPLPLIAAFRISIRQCRAAFRISIRIRIRISILISIRVSIRRFSYFLWREDPPGGKEDKEGGRTPWGTNSTIRAFYPSCRIDYYFCD